MNDMRKLMETVNENFDDFDNLDDQYNNYDEDELVTRFEEELDTLLNNYWGYAERIKDPGNTEAVQQRLDAALRSFVQVGSEG